MVPVRSPGRIGEGLAPAAALPIDLMIGSLHGVDQFQVPGEEAHETVDGELGVMLLAFGPAQLHALQDLFEALLIDVSCGVQAPLEVLPLGEPCFKQASAHGLGVPAPPDVGQPIQHALAVVTGHLDPHEIRQLALFCGDDAVQGQKTGSGKRALARPFFSAATHIDALAGARVVPLLKLKDQWREPRRGRVVLVSVAREAALQGRAVVVFEARLCSMTLQAQGLQLLLLSREGLGDRNDVIDLEGS